MKPDINPSSWSFGDYIDELEGMSEVDIMKGNHKVLAKHLAILKKSNDDLQISLFNEISRLQSILQESKKRLLRASRSQFLNQHGVKMNESPPLEVWAIKDDIDKALDIICKAGI